MHHIQRKILAKLLYADTLTYALMRPDGIESNHYAYHLEQLLKDGYIAKRDKHYMLSSKGLAAIDRMSQEQMTERLQPHIITVIDITNEAGQTLLFKRSFQPYIHCYGFPLGKTHYDEDVQSAAKRELREKTGLHGIPLTQRGVAYVEATRDGVTISKVFCHIFQGHVDNAPPVVPEALHRGESVWMDHSSLTASQVMPGFFAIKELLKNEPGYFFAELREDCKGSV